MPEQPDGPKRAEQQLRGPRPTCRSRASPCSISPSPAPGRPACAISPTGAPTSSASSRPTAAARRSAARAHGFDFQNLHRNKRAIRAQPEDRRRATPPSCGWSKTADVIVENMRAAREASAEDRLGRRAGGQPAHRLRQHQRLRPDRPVRHARRRRPDRAGHGRADVDHRPARPGAGARRHPDRRPDRRQPAGARHHDGAVRARADRRGPLGADQPARGAGLHARLPGHPLADGRRGRAARPATTTRPASRPACSRPATGTSTSPPARRGCGSGSARPIGQPEWQTSEEWKTQDGRSARPQGDQRRDRRGHARRKPSAHWIELFEDAGIPCGPINTIDQVFADPQVKHLGMAHADAAPQAAARPRSWRRRSTSSGFSKATSARRTPDAGEHTDEVLRAVGYADAEIARHAAEGSDLNGVTHEHHANSPTARCCRQG